LNDFLDANGWTATLQEPAAASILPDVFAELSTLRRRAESGGGICRARGDEKHDYGGLHSAFNVRSPLAIGQEAIP
jgi:hypothetical protein